MKNVHRLNGEIYITSNEITKLDELGINTVNSVVYKDKGFTPTKYEKDNCRRIIMSSDKQLNVQDIDSSVLSFLAENLVIEYLDVEFNLVSPMGRKVDPNNVNQNHSGCKWLYQVNLPYKKYPIGGFAPGFYMCNCVTCKERFQGDKRAVQCESCAIKMANKVTQVISPEQETLEKIKFALSCGNEAQAIRILEQYKDRF